jgi:tetratricopeptide (TPR) repeat protein
LIAGEREGAEVAALPGIVMRRRSPRHVYMASAVLMRRFVEADDRRKAIFYGEIARTASNELGEPMARATILNYLGITLNADSQFATAITVLEEALDAVAQLEGRDEAHTLRAVILANLGYARILTNGVKEGVRILEQVLPDMDEQYLVAEVCLDLCFGYLELERYDIAEMYGRRGLELATMNRQVRNANHLLGEICLRTDRYDESDAHFDVVASFYPDFKNVKQLLVAVDLCSVVNWKA